MAITLRGTKGSELTHAELDANFSTLVSADSTLAAADATHAALTTTHGVLGTLVGTTDTQTLTNKTVVVANNTVTTASSGNLAATELNSALAELQTDIDTRQVTITGAATTITSADLTANRALASNVSGKVVVSTVTDTELGYMSGVTSAIQTQLGNKQPLDALLTSLAGQTTAANNVQAYSGADTASLLSTGTASGNIPLVGTSSATETLAGLVELATSAEVAAGTDTARAITPASLAASKIVLGTAITTTSGTSHDFTGIPSWVKRITLMFIGVSTNGTDAKLIQLGYSGGIETTGYLGSGTTLAASTLATSAYTTGFGIRALSAADVLHGSITLSLLSSTNNTWVSSGVMTNSGAIATIAASGSKNLSGVLTQIRLTTVGGTDTFDAGTINIIYE